MVGVEVGIMVVIALGMVGGLRGLRRVVGSLNALVVSAGIWDLGKEEGMELVSIGMWSCRPGV